jgi:hypothetical protein
MRRGLMQWREDELGEATVRARQTRTQAALRAAGLDALLVYTNHVRPAGVTWLTGFTPYWADALLLVPVVGECVFLTALSKRVGNWIRSVAPVMEVAHSLQPGRLAGQRLGAAGARRVGVVELDRLPGGLFEEIVAAGPVELVDATALFLALRGTPDAAELSLSAAADAMARDAFAAMVADAVWTERLTAGDVTAPLERAIRLAGAEECYVAVATDLTQGDRFARVDGRTPLGSAFAVRLSVAHNGVWIRRTRAFARDGAVAQRIAVLDGWFAALTARIGVERPIGPRIGALPLPFGASLARWSLEAPHGTFALRQVAGPGHEADHPLPFGNLAVSVAMGPITVPLAGPIGLPREAPSDEAAA